MIDDPGGQVMRMATCQAPGEAGDTSPDTSQGYTATTLCTTSEQSWQQQLSTFITVLLQTGCRIKYFILVENYKEMSQRPYLEIFMQIKDGNLTFRPFKWSWYDYRGCQNPEILWIVMNLLTETHEVQL